MRFIAADDLVRICEDMDMENGDEPNLERILRKHGVDPWHLLQAKAHLKGLRAVDLERNPPEPAAIGRVPATVRRQHSVVPVTVMVDRWTQAEVLVLALSDGTNIAAMDAVREVCGCKVQPVLASPEQIAAALATIDSGAD